MTPKGKGLAWLVVDYGCEHHLMWTVAINETGEIWTYPNTEVRAEKNITMGRIATLKENDEKLIDILDKNLADTIEDMGILEADVRGKLLDHDNEIKKLHARMEIVGFINQSTDVLKHLLVHSQEGIEKLFERIEKLEKSIIDLYVKLEKTEIYNDEIKTLINEMAFQKGSVDALHCRIKQLEQNVLDLSKRC
jgi:polyhydroxyalkanoate synthesis regulator phasin